MWSAWTQSRKSDAASVNISSELRCLDFSVDVNILLGTEEAIALLQKSSPRERRYHRAGVIEGPRLALAAYAGARRPVSQIVRFMLYTSGRVPTLESAEP